MRYLTQALERDGSDADALFFLGIALEAAGQGEAAIAAGRRFLEMDPLSPMAGVLLNSAHWFVGRPAEGLDAHERGLGLDGENPIIHWSLGYTYALLGRLADARVHATWMERARRGHAVYRPTRGAPRRARRAAGRGPRAAGGHRGASPSTRTSRSTSASRYAVAGDHESALRLLEQAVERGFYPHDYIAVHCPFLAPLRGTAAFDRIAERAARRVAEFSA